MPQIKFYKHEPIPMEMHKVKIVQQLNLLPAAQRLEKGTAGWGGSDGRLQCCGAAGHVRADRGR